MLAIAIACIGLLGLATFFAQKRTKEIGVRKAMGASVILIFVAAGLIILITVSIYKVSDS